jgi:hypothetical protein
MYGYYHLLTKSDDELRAMGLSAGISMHGPGMRDAYLWHWPMDWYGDGGGPAVPTEPIPEPPPAKPGDRVMYFLSTASSLSGDVRPKAFGLLIGVKTDE